MLLGQVIKASQFLLHARARMPLHLSSDSKRASHDHTSTAPVAGGDTAIVLWQCRPQIRRRTRRWSALGSDRRSAEGTQRLHDIALDLVVVPLLAPECNHSIHGNNETPASLVLIERCLVLVEAGTPERSTVARVAREPLCSRDCDRLERLHYAAEQPVCVPIVIMVISHSSMCPYLCVSVH